jgi:predicted nucleic acid-binding protein
MREILVCDSSFVGHLLQRGRMPRRYGGWDRAVLERIYGGVLTISVVTVAEMRAGYLKARWGSGRIAEAERTVAEFAPILIGDPQLDEWARLRVAARRRGVALSDNDLWIAATASSRGCTLVTCDRDHLRIAAELPGDVVYLAPPV